MEVSMRLPRVLFLFLSLLLIAFPLFAQQTPPRDLQAVALLQQSARAMGGSVPSDSVATGAVVLVEGSKTTNGAIRILTRGTDQSAEQIDALGGRRSLIYSQGQANEVEGTTVRQFSLELATSSRWPDFPLVLIAAALNSPDSVFQYVGIETLGTAQAHHVRLWNTFSSNPKLRFLAEFTARDVWLDAVSGLPVKVSYHERTGGGAYSRVPVVVTYSDYRNVGGVLYPFSIEKSVNGTPWAKITITQVSFNTGLTDSDFPIQ